jgi:type III secretion system YscQ/HrcQ family protein
MALSSHIGNGREAPGGDMTLSLAYCAAGDLCWSDTTLDGGAMLWCESSAFTKWLAADYPAGVFADYDSHLYPLLTSLALVQAHDFFYQMRFTPAELISSRLVPDWYPVVTLHREERHLPLVLQGWSVALLRQFTSHWAAWDSPAPPSILPFPLSAGHCLLSAGELRALQAGDGIVLQNTAQIYENHLWLLLSEKCIVMSVSENEIQVVNIQDEIFSVSGQREGISMEDMPVRVVAEVGIAQLALNELMNITPGTIFPTQVSLSGEVRLTVNGFCIGHGRLIMLNDGIVVRINSLIGGAISRPGPERTSEKEGVVTREGGGHGMAC